ncbi:MAG: HEAT repeat domain-containing protein [Desulfarculaceae bacterium]|nr:HEAT repeat domain-containing protein [Desulfarculaceae bacterium]MCF8072403.1 HEAT repeat domain-containing protein [Desulfarculaceae bacterium]MCF8100324.1 HEAT repeat domain-containing protein [Desulfarculaceae bacterium]MCF8117909.1 HEAT repeat domain-containing protein [Desulfarculaceae bacterium]
MLRQEQIMDKARELGFADVGITTAEPFDQQVEILKQRRDEYAWTKAAGLNLTGGVDPAKALPGARSVIVLLELYFKQAYPRELEPFFGRCYLDDDRVTKDGLAVRIRAFRSFLEENGIKAKFPHHLPQRPAAARAGLGDYGKNCLLYAKNCARGGSWVLPLPLVVDAEFTPGEPSMEVGCPDWCKNACLTACPTGALRGPRNLDPRRCISYLTYFGQGLTPRDLREPMGLYVYGCDRCQNVCPRNAPWLAADLEPNPRAAAKAGDFDLVKLLAMDVPYFKGRIWPHMFYMSAKDLWRWHMNVARVMGNTRDEAYVPELARSLDDNPDERARAMSAWALGRIGGVQARRALEARRGQESEMVRLEVEQALGMLG